MTEDTMTPAIWKVRCIHLSKILRNTWQSTMKSRLYAVNTHMLWETPVEQCSSTQILQTGSHAIRAALYGIMWIRQFERKTDLAKITWLTEETLEKDHVTITLAETV